MGNRISTYDTGDIINENESYYVSFRVTDGADDSAVTVTGADIKLHIEGSDSIIYSGSARSSISDTNLVTITLTPNDNQIYDSTNASIRGFEDRRILADIEYSGGQQAQAFLYKIEYSPVTVS